MRTALALAWILLTTAIPLSAARAADPTGPGSVIFGIHAGPSTELEISTIEQSIGRQFAGIRVFYRWDSAFPTAFDLWLRDTDRTPFLSIATRRIDGTPVLWRTIADASPGSPTLTTLTSWAQRIRDYGAPVFFLFSPEPEMMRNSDLGSNLDYIDAWRRVHQLFHDEGVTNATFVWTMTDEAFWITGRNAAANWYPGDAHVDAIGADAYNWYNCKAAFPNGGWKSFYSIVNPLRLFGQQHPTKPLMLPEFGTVEDPQSPDRKAQWFRDAQSLLGSPGWEAFRAVLYFNVTDPFNQNCRFRVNSSPASLAAYAAMGADPHLAGTAEPPPSPPTNQAPVVNAGIDQQIVRWKAAALTGTATDDGSPAPPGAVTSQWTAVSGPGTVTFTDVSSTVTSATFSAPGTYVLRLTASDSVLSASDDITVGVSAGLDVRVGTSSDDAEEAASTGAVTLSGDDLELTTDAGNRQVIGLRFTRITVPRGATITNAWIQFEVDEISTEPTSLTIQAQIADNPPTFRAVTRDVSSRILTTQSVSWTPPTWTTLQLAGPGQRTPSLASIIQPIVNRSGWVSGNAIVLVINGTGLRTAESKDGTSAPTLQIQYRP